MEVVVTGRMWTYVDVMFQTFTVLQGMWELIKIKIFDPK